MVIKIVFSDGSESVIEDVLETDYDDLFYTVLLDGSRIEFSTKMIQYIESNDIEIVFGNDGNVH